MVDVLTFIGRMIQHTRPKAEPVKRSHVLASGTRSFIIEMASWLGWQSVMECSILHKNPKNPKGWEIIKCPTHFHVGLWGESQTIC
jgi:hypothetical protein